MHSKMSTLWVIVHAFLWSLMEVEIEGVRGWMYDSQTACSGLFRYTWYHIVMCMIALLTVSFIMQPNLATKTPRARVRIMVAWLYNVLLWFFVEDVGWFVVNRTTYRSAPWQTTSASVASTVLLPLLVLAMKRLRVRRDYRWDWIILPLAIYMWAPLGIPFDMNEPYMPRNNYCD